MMFRVLAWYPGMLHMNMVWWCPILSSKTADGEYQTKCTADECAWWDKEKGCCVVFSIHGGIQKITNGERYDLQDVYNRIPD